MSVGWLRVRATLDRQYTVVLLIMIGLAAVGGYLIVDVYAQPSTETVEEEQQIWSPDGSFTHGATVIDNESRTGGVFDPGQRVENRSFYYQSIMPTLSGEFTYTFIADSGELTARIEQRLVIRSVDERGENEQATEYWRRTEQLSTNQTTLSPGETVSVPFRTNVTDAAITAEEIRDRLDDPGRTQIQLNATVALTGTAGGREVDRTLEYSLPISLENGIYRVSEANDIPAITETEPRTVSRGPNLQWALAGPLLTTISVAGFLAMVYARRTERLTLTKHERRWLAYQDDRADFDEWITAVKPPEEVHDLPVGHAESLADLVNIAIDTDNPVLESPDGDRFYVIHDGYCYTFHAPPAPQNVNPEEGTDRLESDTTAEETDHAEVD